MLGDRMLGLMTEQINSGDTPRELFHKWSIERTRYVAMLFLVMQLLNVVDGGIFMDAGMFCSFVCLVVLNVAYLIFASVVKRARKYTPAVNALYYSYWMLLPFAMIFFFVFDIQQDALPSNLLIVYLFLATIPILGKAESLVAFAVPYVLNVILGVVFGANLSYYAYGLMFAACGIVASMVAGRQYVMLIERLRYSSSYDQLTGLLSRHVGLPRAETLASGCARGNANLATFMADIDLFKNYNDTYGHVAGDAALKEVAEAIKKCFRRSEDIVMRFGGEEFAIFARLEDPRDAQMLADRVNAAVAALQIKAADGAPAPFMTVSVGVYVGVPDASKSPLELITLWVERADSALYEVKNSGRARNIVTQREN